MNSAKRDSITGIIICNYQARKSSHIILLLSFSFFKRFLEYMNSSTLVTLAVLAKTMDHESE